MGNFSFGTGRRKRVLIPLIVLVLACNGERPSNEAAPASPPPAPNELRAVEARLTGFGRWRRCQAGDDPGKAVQSVDCGPNNIPPELVSITPGECDIVMRDPDAAVRVLAYVPQCTDAAVEKLAAFAASRRDARILSDLAGAYCVRAQRKDQPSDFVRALAAAESGLKLAPALPEARFNLAIAQEALGFSAEAIASWDVLRKERVSGWPTEAQEHWDRLTRARAFSAAVQWPLNQQRLHDAAMAGDRAAVTALVSPYRAAAQRYVEEEVLPAWATAAAGGNEKDARQKLTLAELIASSMATLTRDRCLLAAVERIRTSDVPATAKALQAGHRLLTLARRAQRERKNEEAGAYYEEAERAFAPAGSPVRFTAALGRVTALTYSEKFDAALALLQTIEQEARRARYPYLLARVHAARGFLFIVKGRYIDALTEYTAAESIYDGTGDAENLGVVHVRKLGVTREIGHLEATWREMFRTQRYAASITDLSSRHLLLGETALAAIAIGYPEIGLRFQNTAVRLSQDALAQAASEAAVPALRVNLGIALRGRAGVHARLRSFDAAQADLDQAVPLIGKPASARDEAIPTGFRARLAEVRAQLLAPIDRKAAIESLTEAIRDASNTHYHTLLASLYAQRAELRRLDGESDAAVGDLEHAIAALREEAAEMMRARDWRQPAPDRFWSSYFSRSEEAYRHLIRLLVDGEEDERAFEYAEKARAWEPLHLVLQREDVSSAFRTWLRNGEPLRLPEVKAALPADTYLVQYCVLDDRTYVWIVRNGRSEHRTLPVGNRHIAAWTARLQKSAANRNNEAFNAALAAPYKALLEEPMARIAKLRPAGTHARVVIVPDRAMHGLPFAALHDGRQYLIEKHPVAVAASATLYVFSLARDRELSRGATESVLLFGDPAYNARQDIARGLDRLATAGKEIARLRKVYEPLIEVHWRVRESATVAELLRLAPQSTVVHIAAHGIANPEVPSRSFLLLAPAENDSGTLDAERLVTELRLHKTRLAVLSACSSAGGTPVGPEGLAPLVRPIVAAGVPGVVGTLWNVSDNAATEELVVRFHQHYSRGHDAADALRLAQLAMLDDPDRSRSSPWAWAPFQLNGYASSPFPASAEQKRR